MTDQVVKLLGQGTFGKVVEAYDRKKGTKCAVKIIRSIQKYRDASRIELRVLSTLSSNDKQNRNRCIHLRDCFDFRNHICIVTDLYGQSVFDFLKANHYVPFPSTHIQGFARQLFTSVACRLCLFLANKEPVLIKLQFFTTLGLYILISNQKTYYLSTTSTKHLLITDQFHLPQKARDALPNSEKSFSIPKFA